MAGVRGRVRFGTRAKYKCRKTTVKVHQRLQISELYLKGKAIWEIAKAVGVHQHTVSNDLKIIRQEWRNQTLMNMDQLKVEQLAKLDRIERETWEAWQKSRQDAESEEVVVEQYTTKAGQTKQNVTTKKTKQGQAGAAEFMNVILKCIKQRCDILGLNAPLEVDLKGYDALQASARDKLLQKLNSISQAQQGSTTVQ